MVTEKPAAIVVKFGSVTIRGDGEKVHGHTTNQTKYFLRGDVQGDSGPGGQRKARVSESTGGPRGHRMHNVWSVPALDFAI